MPYSPAVLLALAASATAATAPLPTGPAESPQLMQTLRGQIVIRVPSAPMPAVAAPIVGLNAIQPMRFVEKKGPKCVALGQLGGALVDGGDLDLVLKGGDRVRAKLDRDCTALGFYGGFYLKANSDGQVCSGRDTIRTRSGESCGIKRFHRLVVKR